MQVTQQGQLPDRVAISSLGFLRHHLRARIRALNFATTLNPFCKDVIAWGRRPVSRRAEWLSNKTGAQLWRMEDAFIRSIEPGWSEAPAGLVIDRDRVYFEKKMPLRLSQLLAEGVREFDDAHVRERIERQMTHGISKYNMTPRGTWTRSGYVLVIDQVKGDASIAHGGASAETFAEMLEAAKCDHPNDEILVRTHPAGGGHFAHGSGYEISTEPANPWDVLAGAKAVYVVTSQMGFEAIIAGHRPKVFGHPFYAGWGVSDDMQDISRPRALSIEDLYEFAMMRYPYWFDAAGAQCDFDQMLDGMIAKTLHAHRYANGVALQNISAWKRPHMRAYFRNQKPDGEVLTWGDGEGAIIEDGFLRSRGLGAKLVPPMSLVVDHKGIYFDPTRPSDLEELIKTCKSLTKYESSRTQILIERITSLGISKYNLEAGNAPIIPDGKRAILVIGQVANDRSILKGATGAVKTSTQLIAATRKLYPDAYIIYKPHPDVLSGLREGEIESEGADLIYTDGNLEPLWPVIDGVSTITSLVGFEALLRGKSVDVFGVPFYAEWGLTRDHAPSTGRRENVSLEALVHATLIDYPAYLDPKTQSISTPEIIIDRLASDDDHYPMRLKLASKIQQAMYRVSAKFQRK